MTIRPYADSDLAEITALYNACDVAADSYAGNIEEEVRGMIEAMVRDRATDSRLYIAPNGAIAAVGMVTTPPGAGTQVDLFGGVHPEWRGRGIGRELLAWQIERAGELHRAVAPDVEWVARVGTLSTDTSGLRMYDRIGLTPIRYWFEMLAENAKTPRMPVPAGLSIVEYTTDQQSLTYAAHMEAFADHWGFQSRDSADWSTLTVDLETFRPDLSRVAYDGAEVAGYVLAYEDSRESHVYIGQVGTRRPWRGRGLAAAMMSDVLRSAAEKGFEKTVLGVDADSPTGAVGVYERVGFEVHEQSLTYETRLSAV